MVCTNDAHYLRKEDAEAHDILLCIQTGKTVDDENRMRYEPQNFYLRSEEEMASLFDGCEGALENTQKITEMCNLEFTFGKYHLPEFKLPEGYDSFSYLKKLCDEGYKTRYGDDDKYRGQLKYEQDMIEKMGFTDYFLIVSDFVRYAKSVGIPVGPVSYTHLDVYKRQGRKPSDRLFEATLSLLRGLPDGRRPDAVQSAPFLPRLRKIAG